MTLGALSCGLWPSWSRRAGGGATIQSRRAGPHAVRVELGRCGAGETSTG